MPHRTIAFQGWPGANSDLACRQIRPELKTLPCPSFEDTIAAVHDGRAALALIPIENSVAGRVADIHHLLPDSGLHIVAEHFQRVHHHLVGVTGTVLSDIRRVHSHVHALGQCKSLIRRLGVEPVVHADTAGAAKMVAALGDPGEAAIASHLAAEIYGLAILADNVEDERHNTTRFLIMAPQPDPPPPGAGPTITSFVFEVRSVPAALYKALGGFATNGINMTKLESYMVSGRFAQAQFYADVEGHPEERSLRLALDELAFFSKNLTILGVYPAHPFRNDPSQAVGED
ncbi:MAG: prephenate dehydratase [Gammaproteobacteria bacterium]|jgi:prephenate dehydratase|nr:prephenate dehydratase [Gammaproteobacteria bacterium]